MVFKMGEPQKMAAFLRERCDSGMYNLRYLDAEQNLVFIPWPVAPRPTEELPPGFRIFQEWAELSFIKRGLTIDQPEAPTTQKHRFRNALRKADGITHKGDRDGGRIYQFVDKKIRETPSSRNMAAGTFHNDEFSPFNSAYPPQQANYQQQQQPPPPDTAGSPYFETGDQLSLQPNNLTQGLPENWLDSEMDGVDIELDDLIPDMLDDGPIPINPSFTTQPDDTTNPHRITPQYHPVGIPLPRRQVTDHTKLQIKVFYRGEDRFTHDVTNENGCRVYYGSCAPKLAQYLNPVQLLNQRHDTEQLYGPDSIEQVQLTSDEQFMLTMKQKQSTDAILNNMGRGLVLILDNQNAGRSGGVPDVHAIRLCQTRIFPYNGDDMARNEHEQQACGLPPVDSLKRMEWNKVFDGHEFYRRLSMATNSSKFPCPSFSLSLGQRANGKQKSALFVMMTVRVQKAYQAIQAKLENSIECEVYISGTTSMDEDALRLARKIKETLTLE
uniref:interferon regulatory factor 6-like isoform X2 n=1 Tax=Ciona intestinalis TaxID=7719 RepID=UPI000521CAFC|nr:interferon regulatory factor 6-like isoform X2 [Ciona intestinalis]|eukprot:XP_009861598.1 interferon regulatory factor 6-like isoform X2 [Ciona intestinalis]